MRTRLLPLLLLCGLVLAAGLVLAPRLGAPDAADAAAEHPYLRHQGMTPEELKAIPKADRPDLAAEQHYFLTMDPATGTVPHERLIEANRRATELKRARRGGGSLVTEEWEERGPTNVGGRSRAIMFDPNDPNQRKVWAGGVSGGLWYTDDITDVAAEWTAIDDFWANLAVSSIAHDPSDPQVFYVGTGEGWFNIDAARGAGIFKTEDGGQTWELLPATQTPSFQYVQDVIVHPSSGDVYAATRTGGVQRSQDGGQTWERVLGTALGAGTNSVADLEVGADGTLYAALGVFSTGGIYASASGDSGAWTHLTGDGSGFPTSGFQRIEIATALSNPDVIYALTQSSNQGAGGIYRSEDGGASWSTRSLPVDADPGIGGDFTRGQAWYDLIIQVDPNDDQAIFVGGIDLFKSTTGGSSWTQISHWTGSFGEPYVHADQHNIIFKPGSSDEIVFSNDGGIYYTADGTQPQPTFLNRNNGFNVTQFYSGAIAPTPGSDVMLAGAQDNGVQRFDSPGTGETDQVRGGDGAYTFIDQDQPVLAIGSYVYNNFYRSANGGLSFPVTLISENTGFFINPAVYDSRENILYTNRGAASFWRVKNVNATPSAEVVPATILGSATALEVSPFSPAGTSTLYIGSGTGRIYRIANAESASPVITELGTTGRPTGGSRVISSIEFGASEDALIITYSSYGIASVFETFDGGQTWIDREGDLPDIPVHDALYHPDAPGAVIIATEAGVWETLNFGDPNPTWTPSPSFPTVRATMLKHRETDDMVMASTHGRGVFTAPFRAGVVSNEGDAAVVPGTHELAAAYPNPFADRASFSLRVAEAQRVRVEVYDARGRRVATLHDGALAAGTPHRFTLDGAGLASGTYLYTVTGERFRDEGRVTLVR